MRKLRKDAERAPVSNIVIILLLVVGFASFPIKDTIGFFGLEYTGANRYLFTAAFRLLFLAVMVYFLFTYRFQKSLNFRFRRFYAVIHRRFGNRAGAGECVRGNVGALSFANALYHRV